MKKGAGVCNAGIVDKARQPGPGQPDLHLTGRRRHAGRIGHVEYQRGERLPEFLRKPFSVSCLTD